MSLKIFNFPNSIISRYLLKSLVVFFLAIFFVIGLIVFGNQFVLTVQESVEHGIPIQELMPIVGFNMLRDLPIILSLSFFLSIIISISQFYKNSEAFTVSSSAKLFCCFAHGTAKIVSAKTKRNKNITTGLM